MNRIIFDPKYPTSYVQDRPGNATPFQEIDINFSASQHSCWGRVLSYLYYEDNEEVLKHCFAWENRCGFPDNCGQHTLLVSAKSDEVLIFLGVIDEMILPVISLKEEYLDEIKDYMNALRKVIADSRGFSWMSPPQPAEKIKISDDVMQPATGLKLLKLNRAWSHE